MGFCEVDVGRGFLGGEVAPALEGFDGSAFHLDEGWVEDEAGAGGAVVPVVRDDVEDALAGEHGSGDDPVDAAAAGDFGDAAGLVSGLVAEGGSGGLAGGLDLVEVGDVADADG